MTRHKSIYLVGRQTENKNDRKTPEKLGGNFSALFEKSGRSPERDYEELEIDGIKCAVCSNLGQVRKALESKNSYGIIKI